MEERAHQVNEMYELLDVYEVKIAAQVRRRRHRHHRHLHRHRRLHHHLRHHRHLHHHTSSSSTSTAAQDAVEGRPQGGARHLRRQDGRRRRRRRAADASGAPHTPPSPAPRPPPLPASSPAHPVPPLPPAQMTVSLERSIDKLNEDLMSIFTTLHTGEFVDPACDPEVVLERLGEVHTQLEAIGEQAEDYKQMQDTFHISQYEFTQLRDTISQYKLKIEIWSKLDTWNKSMKSGSPPTSGPRRREDGGRRRRVLQGRPQDGEAPAPGPGGGDVRGERRGLQDGDGGDQRPRQPRDPGAPLEQDLRRAGAAVLRRHAVHDGAAVGLEVHSPRRPHRRGVGDRVGRVRPEQLLEKILASWADTRSSRSTTATRPTSSSSAASTR